MSQIENDYWTLAARRALLAQLIAQGDADSQTLLSYVEISNRMAEIKKKAVIQ